MKKIIFALGVWLFAGTALAAGGGPALMDSNASLSSKTSLQRGARIFVNYCLSCHSASYMRYNRMIEDLGLSREAVETYLLFTRSKVVDTMTIAMTPRDAEQWFGVPPPDLSVIARSRGPDWLYSFFMSFYIDDSRPTGVNNVYFPETAMPHVLVEMQGLQRLVEGEQAEDENGAHAGSPEFELVVGGKLNAEEYQQTVSDLVNFLVYVGEPAKMVRYRVGFWVISFLLLLLAVTYMLKQEYWKDVH